MWGSPFTLGVVSYIKGSSWCLTQRRSGLQPAKPSAVAMAESAQEVDADMVDIIEAYNVALGRYVRLVRDTLPLYSGYECKEPEPGKFTIAFP